MDGLAARQGLEIRSVLVARDVWAGPPGAAAPVLRGVTLGVGQGEWLAVTGPNGGGKTTLALAAAGLWAISSGRLEVDGSPLSATATGRARAGIAAVLQEPASQLFERTVRAEIAFTARNLGAEAATLTAAVSEWSDRLHLSDVLDRDPRELSAGRQQIVLMAGALASGPRLLVADEAAAHLDPGARRMVLDVVRQRVAAGLAVLWITQDAGECHAADRAERLASGALDGTGGAADARPSRLQWPEPSGGPARVRVRIDPHRAPSGRSVRIGHPIEFVVAPGHPIALMGPNGSGKSVVLEAIAGISNCPQVACEFESPPRFGPILAAQHPEMQVFGDSVREELAFAAEARAGTSKNALGLATQVLAEVGVGCEFMERSTWTMSAGERRLLQVVSALVTPASAVLLDEPTCGLDPGRSSDLGHVLEQAARRAPLVVATQDPDLPGRIGATQVWLGE